MRRPRPPESRLQMSGSQDGARVQELRTLVEQLQEELVAVKDEAATSEAKLREENAALREALSAAGTAKSERLPPPPPLAAPVPLDRPFKTSYEADGEPPGSVRMAAPAPVMPVPSAQSRASKPESKPESKVSPRAPGAGMALPLGFLPGDSRDAGSLTAEGVWKGISATEPPPLPDIGADPAFEVNSRPASSHSWERNLGGDSDLDLEEFQVREEFTGRVFWQARHKRCDW